MKIEDLIIPGAAAAVERLAKVAARRRRVEEHLGLREPERAKPLPMIDPEICGDMLIYVGHVHPPEPDNPPYPV